jgi:molybdate transport system substrate-binding protein
MLHLLAALFLLMPTLTSAQTTLRVYAAGAVTPVVRELASAFAARSDTKVDVVSDTVGGLQKRLIAGEAADVVVISMAGLQALQKAGIADMFFNPLGTALLGVCVRSGAPAPEVSTVDAFKAALVNARSISLVNPAAGGTAGTYMDTLLQTLGIADQVKSKIVYRNQGALVADAVATGAAEMGISFSSELVPNPGVRLAGMLPESIQLPTRYVAAVMINAPAQQQVIAKPFVDAFGTPAARAAIKKAGLVPVVGQ